MIYNYGLSESTYSHIASKRWGAEHHGKFRVGYPRWLPQIVGRGIEFRVKHRKCIVCSERESMSSDVHRQAARKLHYTEQPSSSLELDDGTRSELTNKEMTGEIGVL